jgi:hypothetical protein
LTHNSDTGRHEEPDIGLSYGPGFAVVLGRRRSA